MTPTDQQLLLDMLARIYMEVALEQLLVEGPTEDDTQQPDQGDKHGQAKQHG
jgi:hypothetical protein